MDPKANIAEQLEIAHKIQELRDGDNVTFYPSDNDVAVADLAERLVELIFALDEWRRAGGFDPYTS